MPSRVLCHRRMTPQSVSPLGTRETSLRYNRAVPRHLRKTVAVFVVHSMCSKKNKRSLQAAKSAGYGLLMLRFYEYRVCSFPIFIASRANLARHDDFLRFLRFKGIAVHETLGLRDSLAHRVNYSQRYDYERMSSVWA